MSSIFDAPRWLGYNHDGHNLTTQFSDYLAIRQARDAEFGAPDQTPAYQSWLTLGLLEFATLRHTREHELLAHVMVNGVQVPVLCSRKIPVVLRHCDTLPARLDALALQGHVENIESALSGAMGILQDWIRSIRVESSGWPDVVPASLYFVCIVCEAVTVALNGLCLKARLRRGEKGPGPRSWNLVLELFRNQVMGVALRNAWCPSVLNFLLGDATTSVVGYTVGQKSFASGVHTECSALLCKANIVDPDNYTAKHVEAGCSCALIGPLCEDVTNTILQGQIPILNLDQSHPGQPYCLNLQSVDEVEYIAFSHVWADGLGSTTETGLPSCQVRKLSALATELVPGGHFWIDSLCVPQERTPRKKAIEMMALTYRKAAKVLVLDTSIQSCKSSDSPEQKLLRVLVSSWMRRLWTLQEAVLAAELVFRFMDVSLSIHDLIPKMVELHQNPLLTSLSINVHRLTKKRDDHVFTLGDVSSALRWRTTTRMADETLAIASLLGVDVVVLLGTKSEERIPKLLLMIKNIPLNALFLSGEKFTIPGFRWAPRTLMNHSGGLNLSPAQNQAEVTPAGLVGIYHIYILPTRTLVFEPGKWWQIAEQDGPHLQVMDPYGQKLNMTKYRCDIIILPDQLAPGNSLAAVAAHLRDYDNMGSSNIARKERRKKQTRLTFDPISTEVPLDLPAKSQGPSPAKVRYERTNGGTSAGSGGRITRSGMSSGSPSKVTSGMKGKSGGKGKNARDGKISFGSLPTPAKSSQKEEIVVADAEVTSGSRRSTRSSKMKKPIIEDAPGSEDEFTIEVTTPSKKNKEGSTATEAVGDDSDIEITGSTTKSSGAGSSRRRSLTGRGFIQGGSTYNAPLPSSGNRGRAPKVLVHSPKPPTPSKTTPKKRSVTLSDTSDDDVFTSNSRPSQRPGLFSQKLAAPIESSDESGEEADEDSEDDILPSSTRRRQATRIVPQVALEIDSGDPDDEPPTSPMKRKRPTIISDDEDSIVRSPAKRARVVDESDSDDDLPSMTKLSKTTPPESDSPAPSPQVKRKGPPRKHRTAKQKQLEILKRKRAGESNLILTESESDGEEVGGLYDSGSDALTTFEDEEEEEEVEEEVQEMRKRKSPKKPVRENEDDYDSDFVDDDDVGLLGVPDYAMIPLHLTAAAHKPLREHFPEAVEWCVQNKINPGFNQNLMPIYKAAWNKLEDAYSGLSGSKFVSTSWTRDFTKGLYARPEFITRRLAPGEAIDLLGEAKCEACNRRKHIPTFGITLRGSAYHKDSLAEVEKDDSDTEEDDEKEDSDDEKDTRSLNSRDEPLPPQDKEFMVGSVCKENAENAHTLIHLKYALNQWVIGSLESQGHLTIEKLAKRDKMSAKKRQKEVNGIVDKWKEEKEIKELYGIWKQQLETAQNASTTGRR
ncbi:hypothetical protein BOTCAL_0609g00020 [Botryotinia calthae]|uniref:DUF4211 domain-containing protein n=1 Tax=Botryotinia calthae TaxID=38488 RepID=A0A4Y8CJJ8_9HELO|nr:hypothetical protein BOTCAL_0609g00020 [Botryotinia calthae]